MRIINNVIIIEDDLVASMIIQKQVKTHPFIKESRTFTNGELALEYIKAKLASEGTLPDLILLDISMPVMDGWQFLEAFAYLNKPKQVPIVMLTSSIDPEDIAKAHSYQAVKGFLSKPLTSKHLEQVMDLLETL